MKETGVRNGAFGAEKFGLNELAAVHWNLTEPSLYEHSVRAGEATIVAGGALSAFTGHHTGRSPKDKHTVVDDLTRDSVWWDGNRKLSQEHFENLLADKGYDSDKFRTAIAERGAEAVIPSNRSRSQAIPHDKELYKERNLVERFINKIKHYRRIATRYEKTALSYLSMLSLVGAMIWLR